MPLVIFTLMLLLVTTSPAVTPEEYVRNYDSLDHSTTPWSEPMNGLRVRVTYPLELTYGEPLELKVEFICDPNWEAPIRMRRQSLYTPSHVEAHLTVNDLRTGDSTVHQISLPRDQLPWTCWEGFPSRIADGLPISIHFDAIGGVRLEHLYEASPGGKHAIVSEDPVAKKWGLVAGRHALRLTIVRADKASGYTKVIESELFQVRALPDTPLMRHVTVIAPSGIRVTDDCELKAVAPETISVTCEYYHYLHVTTRFKGGWGIRGGATRDTVSLMYITGLWPAIAFDTSTASRLEFTSDSIDICLYSAPGMVEHLGKVSGPKTLLLRRVLPVGATPEEQARICECKAARRRAP